jgi:hypothetical protein
MLLLVAAVQKKLKTLREDKKKRLSGSAGGNVTDPNFEEATDAVVKMSMGVIFVMVILVIAWYIWTIYVFILIAKAVGKGYIDGVGAIALCMVNIFFGPVIPHALLIAYYNKPISFPNQNGNYNNPNPIGTPLR